MTDKRASVIWWDEMTDYCKGTPLDGEAIGRSVAEKIRFIHKDSPEAKAAIAGQHKTGRLPGTIRGFSGYKGK